MSGVVAIGIALAAALAVTGCAEPGVVRIVDGRAVEGRYISETAYALYARGADAEARGDASTALRAYQAALGEDPESAEIWTRIGAVSCRAAGAPGSAGARAVVKARTAFIRAQMIDATYAPLWREEARCLAAAHERGALEASARAVELDPDDEGAWLLHARLLDEAGRVDDLRRTLWSLVVRRPGLTDAAAALYDHARKSGDRALMLHAGRKLAALAPARAAEIAGDVPALSAVAGVDAALVAGDLAEARRRAHRARIASADVALRAAALGKAAIAREQAELVAAADPADASARIALAAAADLSGDEALLAAAMRGIPGQVTTASPLARLLFAEVLARHVSAAAASAWLGPSQIVAGDDALVAAVDRRVHARLTPR